MSDTEHPLISVIVPVYNVEPYLDRCIQSLVSQSYRNLEIILVDDGSPDKCPQICDAWAAKDSRVRVIHQENKGLAGARNSGLDIANGEFIGFVDSDDWVDEDMYSKLYAWLIADNADIAFTTAIYAFPDSHVSTKHIKRNVHLRLSTEEAFKYINLPGYMSISAWCKLLKKSIVDGITFPEGIIRDEDYGFAYSTLARATRVTFDSTPLYFYYQRDTGSLSHSFPILYAAEATKAMVDLVQKRYPQQLPYALYKHLIVMTGIYDQAIMLNLWDEPEWTCLLGQIRECAKRHLSIVANEVKPPKLRLLQIRLLIVSPILYRWCFTLYKTFHPERAD